MTPRQLPLLLVLVVGLLSACGGDTVALDPVASAAAKTSEAGSAQVEFQMTGDLPTGRFTGRGEGVFNNDDGSGRMSMELSAGTFRMNMEAVFVFPVVYMRFHDVPELALPEGKSWLKVDLQKAGEQLGFDLNGLMDAAPTDTIAWLRSTSNVQEVGREQIRGVGTTHYRATVDLAKALEAAPADERAAIERLLGTAGSDQMPVEVWVDDNGLVRRLEQRFTQTIPDAGPVEMTVELEMHDFGPRIEVEAPPGDQVVDALELASAGG